jgi:hypothetical protein
VGSTDGDRNAELLNANNSFADRRVTGMLKSKKKCHFNSNARDRGIDRALSRRAPDRYNRAPAPITTVPPHQAHIGVCVCVKRYGCKGRAGAHLTLSPASLTDEAAAAAAAAAAAQYVHAVSVYIARRPSAAELAAFRGLFDVVGSVYPCEDCRGGLTRRERERGRGRELGLTRRDGREGARLG